MIFYDYTVKTRYGTFNGFVDENGINTWRGIPCAQPPVGELRRKAPEPLPESEDVFEAEYFGASTVQVDYDGSPFKHFCLTLNIYVGTQKTAKKKPVIVIFHHGDFSYGGAVNQPSGGVRAGKKFVPKSIHIPWEPTADETAEGSNAETGAEFIHSCPRRQVYATYRGGAVAGVEFIIGLTCAPISMSKRRQRRSWRQRQIYLSSATL